MNRRIYACAAFLALLAALGTGSVLLEKRVAVEAAGVARRRNLKSTPCGRSPFPIIGS